MTMAAMLCQAIEPQISEEELTRRERQGRGRPLADILREGATTCNDTAITGQFETPRGHCRE
jgi:hypothetical protein